jgi:hypothetical protein
MTHNQAALGNAGLLCLGGRDLPAVEVATPTPAKPLRPQLPLQQHQAPDPGAIGTDIRLDLGGQLTDGG